MRRISIFLITLILVFGFAISIHAAFIDRGGGMVYDTDLDVTWLQDANYAMTSGYDDDGLMTWNEANTWAEGLVIAGYDNWRLPTFDPANPRPTTATSVNEIGSLLLALDGGDYALYYGDDISPFYNLPHLLSDTGEFSSIYWTGLPYDGSNAWEYYMDCG